MAPLQLGIACWICGCPDLALRCDWCGMPACSSHRHDEYGTVQCAVCPLPSRAPQTWPADLREASDRMATRPIRLLSMLDEPVADATLTPSVSPAIVVPTPVPASQPRAPIDDRGPAKPRACDWLARRILDEATPIEDPGLAAAALCRSPRPWTVPSLRLALSLALPTVAADLEASGKWRAGMMWAWTWERNYLLADLLGWAGQSRRDDIRGFCALAIGAAASSFQPGGVDVLGMHIETPTDPEDYPRQVGPLTGYPFGDMGRIVPRLRGKGA